MSQVVETVPPARSPESPGGMAGAAEVAPEPARPRIAALDGLRGLAILGVLAVHFGLDRESDAAIGSHGGIFQLLRLGWIGVDLFFVLSGFLITGILLDAKGSPRFFRTFYVRRALRILPASLAVLVALHFLLPRALDAATLAQFRSDEPWLFLYAINLRAFVTDRLGTEGTAHFWSLACEEQFYLLWPFVVAALAPKRLLALSVALIPGAALLRIGLLAAGAAPVAVHPFLLFRVDGFAAGAVVALLARRTDFAALRSRAALLGGAAFAALAAACAAFGSISAQGRVMQTAGFSLLSVGFAALLVVVLGSPEGSPLRRALSFAPLRALGFLSYGVYLVHFPLRPLVESLVRSARPLPFAAERVLAFTLATAFSVALAALSWRLVEKPALGLRGRFGAP